jgi:hypothetical protein
MCPVRSVTYVSGRSQLLGTTAESGDSNWGSNWEKTASIVRDGLDPFLPPTPTINVLRHVDIGMPHIVTRDFRTRAGSQHQTAMHCPEAPEVDCFGQTQLHCSHLDLPI